MLFGTILGAFSTITAYSAQLAPEWLGGLPARPLTHGDGELRALLGTAQSLGIWGASVLQAAVFALTLGLAWVLLRRALRHAWLSELAFTGLLTLLWGLSRDGEVGAYTWSLSVMTAYAVTWLLSREGLLALLVAALQFLTLTRLPLHFGATGWYASSAVLALLLFALPLLVGALGQRRFARSAL
jgi:hypothetical protein